MHIIRAAKSVHILNRIISGKNESLYRILPEVNRIQINYKFKRKSGKVQRQKNRIKRAERSNTFLTHVCNLPQSIKSQERVDNNRVFSQYYDFRQLMKATIMTESSSFIHFFLTPNSPQQTANMIQVCVAPFSSF